VSTLVRIEAVVLERSRMLKSNRQTNRQTTGDQKSSLELSTQMSKKNEVLFIYVRRGVNNIGFFMSA
jgi:hypothetical protein